MATRVEDFSLFRAMEGVERALKTINRSDGFNTDPRVQVGAVLLDDIGDGDFPTLAFEMGDLFNAASGDLFGGAGSTSTGELRFGWPCFVWGYVRSTEDKKALYRAGTALLSDVYAAIYADETLEDGAGNYTTLFVNPGEVVFDMESFATKLKGYFAARFDLIVNVTRGANP